MGIHKHLFATAIGCLIMASALLAQTPGKVPQADFAEARAIFKQLIEINTTDSMGNVTAAAEAMAQRFVSAGFPKEDVQVLGPDSPDKSGRKKNLLVRYRGTGSDKKPIVFIAHLDVVEALRSDWTTDPFQFVEKDGFYYGRGTQDMKANDAILVANLIRLYREGFKPDRDILLALTADEEGGSYNGVAWLLENNLSVRQSAYAINPDAGGVDLVKGHPVTVGVEATEKVYGDFEVTAKNPGGHSSLPRSDNAIYELTAALGKLAQYKFPFELNDVTRAYLTKLSTIETGQNAEDLKGILKTPPDEAALTRIGSQPNFNSIIRTTCVATRLQAGHANNALPQTAIANVNCRILPGHSPEEVRDQLASAIADPNIEVKHIGSIGRRVPGKPMAPPPPLPEVFTPLTAIAQSIWPGAPVVPTMEAGASDSIYMAQVSIPSYGFSALAIERDDVRAHGKDERLPIDSFEKGLAFYYAFIKALTTP
jgi:acetylornithine deacetylase/succinyl-diaminopimelate desuccinylase-like protein